MEEENIALIESGKEPIEEKKIIHEEKRVPVFKIQHCAFPDCYGEAKVQVSNLAFCRRHGEFARFFLWIAGKITVKDPNVTDSGLIIPK